MSTFAFYLLLVFIPALEAFSQILTVVLVILGGMGLIIYFVELQGVEIGGKVKKWSVRLLVIAIFSAAATVILPSKKETITLIAIHYGIEAIETIVAIEGVDSLPQEAVDALRRTLQQAGKGAEQ